MALDLSQSIHMAKDVREDLVVVVADVTEVVAVDTLVVVFDHNMKLMIVIVIICRMVHINYMEHYRIIYAKMTIQKLCYQVVMMEMEK